MIRITLKLDSLLLHCPVEINIALPQLLSFDKEKVKTIWFLHCALSDGALFHERLNIYDLVEENKFAVVCPSLSNSHFVNSDLGAFADFLDLELYPYLHSIFPFSKDRANNVCVGISMGALGAFLWSIRKKLYFGRVICISGLYDIRLALDSRLNEDRKGKMLLNMVKPFIEKAIMDSSKTIKADCDILKIISSLKSSDELPKFDFFSGNEDFISLKQSENISHLLKIQGIRSTLTIFDGGHDIKSWRNCLCIAFSNL